MMILSMTMGLRVVVNLQSVAVVVSFGQDRFQSSLLPGLGADDGQELGTSEGNTLGLELG